jgi:hypothetical protein
LGKVAKIMGKYDSMINALYRKRIKLPEEKVTELMDAEGWFTPNEAKEIGFVDEIVDAINIDGKVFAITDFAVKMDDGEDEEKTITTYQTKNILTNKGYEPLGIRFLNSFNHNNDMKKNTFFEKLQNFFGDNGYEISEKDEKGETKPVDISNALKNAFDGVEFTAEIEGVEGLKSQVLEIETTLKGLNELTQKIDSLTELENSVKELKAAKTGEAVKSTETELTKTNDILKALRDEVATMKGAEKTPDNNGGKPTPEGDTDEDKDAALTLWFKNKGFDTAKILKKHAQ